jgi:hypothetical protein
MEPSDWIALVGTLVALAGVITAAGVSLLSMRYADRQRQRERQADREEKDRAKDEADRARRAEWRESLLVSLLPLVRMLAEFPPAEDSDREVIQGHIERLRSESMNRAMESLVYVGMVYPSENAAHAAGYVSGLLSSVLLIEESALMSSDPKERKHLLEAAHQALLKAEEKVRELAWEISRASQWRVEVKVPSDGPSADPETTAEQVGDAPSQDDRSS